MESRPLIIGAGIAGLIAAHELEEKGLNPLILEAANQPGGRIRTDESNGFLLDRGFQVLPTAYEEVGRYLDQEALDLCHFEPGALIFTGERNMRISDPLRQPGQLFSAAFSPVGSPKDKWLLWKLTRRLKKLSPAECFQHREERTLDFLKTFGFSHRIIEHFFRPFFAGIFLEDELDTSARMFRFVFKMFGEGVAAVPAKGMEEIPRHLRGKLERTEILYDQRVAR
ncbi:MAG: FAD-dependent oxidoreductase, partial [Saprospiraceae bacterium]|nr:FAD-dependent oxidoreductase [Saprospiraceae bacterium]